MQQSPLAIHWLILLLLGVIWGSSFMAVGVAVADYGPFTIAAARLGIGAAILSGYIALTGRRLANFSTPEGRKFWRFAIMMGFFSNALPFALLSWAQNYVTSSFAGLCMATVPLAILPLAHIFIPADRLTSFKLIGFIIGFFGTVILIDPFGVGGMHIALPEMACILASFSYAVGAIITRFSPSETPIRMGAGALIAGFVILMPMVAFFDTLPTAMHWPSTLALIYLGLFPTGLAMIFIVKMVREAGPSFLSLVNYMVPIWAMVFGVWFLDESIPTSFVLALTLVLLGVLISQRGAKVSGWLRRVLG